MNKVPIIHFIWLFVPVLVLASSASADRAGDLKQAQGLYQAGQYAQAEQLCRNVLQSAAGDPEAVYQAGKLLPQVYLATDRPAEAQAAVQELLIKSAQNEFLPHALHEIIEQAKALNKTAQAGQICQSLLAARPDQPQTLWLKMGAVLANVYGGNSPAVDAGVQDIVANDSTDQWAGEALAQIGWAYDKTGQYDKGRTVYEYVVDHWPDKPRVIYAHTALVRDCIRLSDKQAAQSRLQQLTSRYVQDTHLPNVLSEIARGYREAALYAEAKPVCQYVLDHYPDSDQCLWAQRDVILSDIGLGNREAAGAGVQKLLANYTKDGNLPWAINDIAKGYREARMYEQAKPVSQFLLDHYPNSDQRIWADRDILLCDVRLHNQDAAQTEFQKLISRYADNGYLPYVLVDISGQYRQTRMYSQARSTSQYVLDHYPDSDCCLWAQRDVVLSALALRDLDTADAEAQKLVSRFANRPDTFWAVSDIAEANSRSGRHQQARDLLRFNVTNYPASENMIWSVRGFINESIALNDDASTDAGIKKLLSEYASSRGLPMVMVHVGRTLCNAGKSQQASNLFQGVIDKYPNHEQSLFARTCMGHVYIGQGQDKQGEALYQKILTDYANHPRLAEAINLMAEGYLDQGVALEQAIAKLVGLDQYTKIVREQGRSEAVKNYYQRAIEKWRIIIQKMPPTCDQMARAWYFTGVAYRRHLGDPEKAIPYYQKVAETWPDYEYAWSAQSMLAQCYETLARSGKVTKEEAEPKLEEAYSAVVHKYADCPLAEQTYVKLGMLNFRKGQWDQAVTSFAKYLERYPQTNRWRYVLIYLGATYERQGKREAAAELYRAYLGVADRDDPRVKLVQAKLDNQTKSDKEMEAEE